VKYICFYFSFFLDLNIFIAANQFWDLSLNTKSRSLSGFTQKELEIDFIDVIKTYSYSNATDTNSMILKLKKEFILQFR
jgi:hypothetical protein